MRSLTVAMDGGMMVAANNHGTCYVWRMMRGAGLMLERVSHVKWETWGPLLDGHQTVAAAKQSFVWRVK